jgi:hypothetical protein
MQLNSLLETLNLSNKDGLYFYGDLSNKKTDFLSIRVKETFLDYLKPDAFFCINNEPLILFFESKRDLIILEKQIWNFNQTPVIFINEDNQWIIKNGFKLLETNNRLNTLTNSLYISDFEYFELITGKCWEKYRNDFDQKYRVDFKLLENIEEARNVLINPKLGNLHPKVANSLIGRVIFIRYLIDREVELGEKYEINGKEDFYNLLLNKQKTYTFFQKIKDNFNGNLFPLEYKIDGHQIKEVDKVDDYHLSFIINLLRGYKINKDSSVQSSFFDIYDFSIIPIEFVSNVYEKFIGEDKQADSGAYYTPLFLVDYIQKETVSNFFRQNPKEYNCKVLDPACGSGIFLVESLRQIIAQYQSLHPVNEKNELEYNKYKEKLKTLLKDNIFGIDKDENAITVAIFSLYITLLDNLKPKSIVGFRFPELIGSNFFSNDFFDTEKDFNTILKNHHFQFILGNPPWATIHPKKKQLFESYIEDRQKKESSNLEIIHREIAEAFLVRVSDFNFDETAFIVVSKVLYKLEKQGVFRNYFLNKFSLRQVVELSSVRHQIFNKSNDSAIAPATIMFYKKEDNINKIKDNIVKHISLKPNIFFEIFKLMVIEKYDVKEISQANFIEEDWVWKVLVYGNILDYYFIKRLKENYETVGFITKQGYVKKGGLQRKNTNKKEKADVTTLIGVPFINTQKKELKMFYIHSSKLWDEKIVAFCPDKTVFNAPILLSTKGVDSSFSIKSAISYIDSVYTDSLIGIKAINQSSINVLKSISAIWNSSFSIYFNTLTASSIGIEREQLYFEEKLKIPFITNDNLVEVYSRVENISKQYYENNMVDYFLKNEIDTTIKKIDIEVINLFNSSNKEKSLIDYVNSVTIPLLKGKVKEKKKVGGKIKNKDGVLKDYAQIFIDHFGKRFNADGKYFEVEILWSEYAIFMKFNIIPEKSKEKNCIVWSKIDNKQLLVNITKLGFENISDNLFLQKDIKGFEEDYFYVAKPNQYKSWHSALAYLDLSEFIETFFKINNDNNAL